ncbi:MAG: DUF433 domain-containing protein [Gemmataceae bacterium]
MEVPDFLTEGAYGEIRITGHRIGLFTIIRDFKEGATAESMAEEYPTLRLELINSILGFYHRNVQEVDKYVADYQAELDKQEAAHAPSPALLRIRELMKTKQPEGH